MGYNPFFVTSLHIKLQCIILGHQAWCHCKLYLSNIIIIIDQLLMSTLFDIKLTGSQMSIIVHKDNTLNINAYKLTLLGNNTNCNTSLSLWGTEKAYFDKAINITVTVEDCHLVAFICLSMTCQQLVIRCAHLTPCYT